MYQIPIYALLLNHNEINPFLKRIVNGDEKWVSSDNANKNGRDRIVVGICGQKVLPIYSVGLVENGLLQTLDSDLYCQPLDHVKEAITQKRRPLTNRSGIVFHLDNARPDTSRVTHQEIWELGLEVLMHPIYSADLAPSDYY